MNDELFIYLGKCENTFFFQHLQRNKTTDYMSQCGHIYDVLIRETMIERNDMVFVYNILPNGSIEGVAVGHSSFPITEYPIESVNKILPRLLKARKEDPKTIIICYDGEGYSFTEGVDISESFKDINISHIIVNISQISYVLSTKPISYL